MVFGTEDRSGREQKLNGCAAATKKEREGHIDYFVSNNIDTVKAPPSTPMCGGTMQTLRAKLCTSAD